MACGRSPLFRVPDGRIGGVIAGAFNERVVAVAAIEILVAIEGPMVVAGNADTEIGRILPRAPSVRVVVGGPKGSSGGGCIGAPEGGGGRCEHFDFVFVGLADDEAALVLSLMSSSPSWSSLLSQSFSSSPLFLNSRLRPCRMSSVLSCLGDVTVTVPSEDLEAASPVSLLKRRKRILNSQFCDER